MEGVNIPSENVPAELKACEQILKRAKELKKAEPVVAYWCCFSAAQKAMKAQGRSGEGTRFLMTLLDTLESMKAVLSENEAVNNEAAGAGYVENFALKVFMSADNDDRAGITGKATIRKFVVAGQFIEVLRCFENGMTEEMEQKLQYARWKAADGAKALREGREPVSGPPMPESEINPFPELPVGSPGVASTQLQSSPGMTRGSFSSATRPIVSPPPNNASPAGSTPLVSPSPSPGPKSRSNLPSLETSSRENMKADNTPSRTDSFASGAWSTVATPGVADEEGREKRFDLSKGSPLPSAPPLSPKSPTGDRKNVRFAGPDGAPLSPAQTHITVDSYDTPDAPPPTTATSSPTTPMPPANFQIPGGSSSSSDPSSQARGDSTSSSSRQISNGNGSATGNGVNFPSAPPPSLATAPSAPPIVPQPHGLGLSSPPPSAPPMPALTSAPPTRKQVEQTQKHARWAISALEFDDIETARSELRKALATIGG